MHRYLHGLPLLLTTLKLRLVPAHPCTCCYTCSYSCAGQRKGTSSAQQCSAQLSSAQTPLQNAFNAANKVLEPGGQHIESLGSDALERWVQENAVEKINDNYY